MDQEKNQSGMQNENKSCCNVQRDNLQTVGNETQLSEKSNHTSAINKTGMIYLPGGEFLMGSDSKEGFVGDGEGPVRKVQIEPFYMDTTAVTNKQFKQFVEETGYVTEAEKFTWSFVFHLYLSKSAQKQEIRAVKGVPWWRAIEGAYWMHPEGPGSNLEDRMDHPVVHISWNDAVNYCNWAGKRLPTECEWEYAARGGLEQNRYPWGDELTPNGEHYCNIWQGEFPNHNTGEDGYMTTAPASSFPANGYGIYNMAGNVWEWCSDWFSPTYYKAGDNINPEGPKIGESKMLRGGSYLCHKSYCNRYRVAARHSNTPDSSTAHMGFRCAADAD